MNKAELIACIVEKTGVPEGDTGKVVNALLSTISGALKSGDKVRIVGFGTFYTRVLRERKGYNPVKRESVQLPAVKIPAFKSGKTLKEGVR